MFKECTGKIILLSNPFLDVEFATLKLKRDEIARVLDVPVRKKDESIRKRAIYAKLLECVQCDRRFVLTERDRHNWMERALNACYGGEAAVEQVLEAMKVLLALTLHIF